MSSSWIGTVLLALLALGAGWFAYFQSTRANRVQAEAAKVAALAEKASIDAEAITRAKLIYESIIGDMEGNAGRLRAEVASLREEVGRLNGINFSLTTDLASLRREIDQLQRSNRVLTAEVAALRGPG
jgi:chromosome segregation ATPase